MGITAGLMVTARLAERDTLPIYRRNRDRLAAAYDRLAHAALAMSDNFNHDPEADEVQFGLALEFDAAMVEMKLAQARFYYAKECAAEG